MVDHFTTEFGHQIPFVPGYFDRNKFFAQTFPASHFAKQTLAVAKRTADFDAVQSFRGLYKSLVIFSKLTHFLKRLSLLQTWRRSIDIGAGWGSMSAFFKASGFVEHATNLDLVDYTKALGDYSYQTFLRGMRTVDGGTATRIQGAKFAFDHYPDASLGTGLHGDFPCPAVVDDFQHRDFFEAIGHYDLITAVGVLDLFDIEAALAKVAELLTDDGLFLCLDEYWWFPANSSCISAHFPYAVQRLSYSDLERYIGEYHPEMLPSLPARMHYLFNGKPPTLNDWREMARRQGLRLIASERIMPQRHHRLVDSPVSMLSQDWCRPADVLRDIGYIKSDVTLDDLKTSSVILAFKKL